MDRTYGTHIKSKTNLHRPRKKKVEQGEIKSSLCMRLRKPTATIQSPTLVLQGWEQN